MRVLVLPFIAIALLTACSEQRPVPPQATRPSEPANDYWRQVQAMMVLEREADVILEAEAVDHFRLLKPATADNSATGLDGYLDLIPKRTSSATGLVVLIIPESEIVQGTKKIMDEVILDVRDTANSRGYQRLVVGVHSHGPVIQIYTEGLPSREQVAEKKRSWKETSAKIRMEHAK